MGGLLAVVIATLTGISISAQYDYHDVTPAFWRVYDVSRDEPIAQRVAQIKDDIFRPDMDLYASGELDESLRDNALAAYLGDIDATASKVRAIDRRLTDELPGDIAAVKAALPNLSFAGVHVYVLPSLGAFDAEIHDMPNGVGVFFAPDGMLQNDGPNPNIGVFVAHEFFHVYQYEMRPAFYAGTPSVWQAVWREGSAAYASQHIAPHATAYDALGPQLTSADNAQIAGLACYVQSRFTSERESDIDNLVGNDHPANLPPGGGYLIGYLAAASFAQSHTLAQMGAASPREVEPALKATLQTLCSR